ncbi:NUDIX domain-containing protein [Candidatus Woesearchaeota archaeon]|nr:NUDIX domain-containing protein [Candidatus Woesearchaeota archaeon]MBW3016682.1 NUDIX domain-containing protein [Candidatus Woesearchaeota archaeon]
MIRCSLVIPVAGDKFLFSRRAKDKHPFPDTWVCAIGGKLNDGESFEDAAKREMMEEVGVVVPLKRVCSFHYDAEFKAEFTVFTTLAPLPDKLKLDPAEVQYVKEFFISEIKDMVEKNPGDFAPTFRVALLEFEKNLRK